MKLTHDVVKEISNIKNELIYTYYSNWSNFKVIPFSNLTDELFNNYKNIGDVYMNIVNG